MMMKKIVCIIPEGVAKAVTLLLHESYPEAHVLMHFARGIGRRKTVSFRGFGEQTERDVLEVIVPRDQADEVFEFMYWQAKVCEQHGGVIYQCDLMKSHVTLKPHKAMIASGEGA